MTKIGFSVRLDVDSNKGSNNKNVNNEMLTNRKTANPFRNNGEISLSFLSRQYKINANIAPNAKHKRINQNGYVRMSLIVYLFLLISSYLIREYSL